MKGETDNIQNSNTRKDKIVKVSKTTERILRQVKRKRALALKILANR